MCLLHAHVFERFKKFCDGPVSLRTWVIAFRLVKNCCLCTFWKPSNCYFTETSAMKNYNRRKLFFIRQRVDDLEMDKCMQFLIYFDHTKRKKREQNCSSMDWISQEARNWFLCISTLVYWKILAKKQVCVCMRVIDRSSDSFNLYAFDYI